MSIKLIASCHLELIMNTLLHLLLVSPTLLQFLCAAEQESLAECISNHPSSGYITKFKYIHSPYSPSYSNLLQSAEQNPRWINSKTLKPKFIVTPYNVDEIRAAMECVKKHGLQIRIKSGGHDYEGLSYKSNTPFVLIDLINLRSINVDLEQETAWVQSGATIGELYYSIAQKSNIHGFPAGICPSVGVGGHFSGGGFGTLVRKYGLAADNIIDAYIMNAKGQVLDRKSMGEDLFWAIRGGGGASFGIILAWKIKLVRVPSLVTVFSVSKHVDGAGIKLLGKWQLIANKLSVDVFIRVVVQHIVGTNSNQTEAIFNSLFLGSVEQLLPLMNTSFPELGLQGKDCMEMSWIESVLYIAGFKPDNAKEVLLDRVVQYRSSFKAKSDFAYKPIPESAFEGINDRLMQEEVAFVIMDPYGGKMELIAESELPFPHRKGNLFNIQYLVKWSGDFAAKKHVDWMREMYEFMEPYVSSSPRATYLNYRDLDLGFNQYGKTTNYSRAAVWGRRYFKGNFQRLAAVKKLADPDNFFSHEQSIPLLD